MDKVHVLLDTCVWSGAKKELEYAGFDVKWIGDQADPGDLEIIKMAFKESRVLITLDKDFGELAIYRGEDHSGIIRLVNISVQKHGEVSIYLLERYSTELYSNAIITFETHKVRIRQ